MIQRLVYAMRNRKVRDFILQKALNRNLVCRVENDRCGFAGTQTLVGHFQAGVTSKIRSRKFEFEGLLKIDRRFDCLHSLRIEQALLNGESH